LAAGKDFEKSGASTAQSGWQVFWRRLELGGGLEPGGLASTGALDPLFFRNPTATHVWLHSPGTTVAGRAACSPQGEWIDSPPDCDSGLARVQLN
jgi:hypothetical protein